MSKSLLDEVDLLLKNDENAKVVVLLGPHKNEENDEILWRLAQAMYDLAQAHPDQNSESVKRLYAEGLSLATKALKINEKNSQVHKMMAALLDAHYQSMGLKARAGQMDNVKKHMLRAAELNPKDPHVWFAMGSVSYHMSDLPWAIKKIVGAFYSAISEASFERAFTDFKNVLEVDETKTYKHYKLAVLMCGKCCIKLNRKSEAVSFLKQVLEMSEKTEEEKTAHAEAIKLLKDM